MVLIKQRAVVIRFQICEYLAAIYQKLFLHYPLELANHRVNHANEYPAQSMRDFYDI